MKFIFLILFLSILLACHQKKEDSSLSVNLKYAAYTWHCTDSGFQFYLADYINIDSDGNFILMRHKAFLDTPGYYEGKLDTTSLFLINSMLDIYYKKTYIFKQPEIYDGFYYAVNYKRKVGNNISVRFIPDESPAKLKALSKILDSVIFSTNLKTISIFKINYIEELKKDTSIFPLPHLVKFNLNEPQITLRLI
jgi:hypothetical protein